MEPAAAILERFAAALRSAWFRSYLFPSLVDGCLGYLR